MVRNLRNILRLFKIALTLAKYGCVDALEVFGFPKLPIWVLRKIEPNIANGALGVRLAKAAVALGPSFIKLGQALSTRSDLLGAEMAGDLGQLRDRLPPFPTGTARNIVETELSGSIPELFLEFNDEADAAASIAQVHFAVTMDGRPVAVKVLRPHIEQAFARDIDLLFWVADYITRSRPSWRRLKLRDSVKAFEKMVASEMDFRLEAAAASQLFENFQDDETYQVPAVDWSRTSQRVLTTARVYGTPIDQTHQLSEDGHSLDDILENASRAMFNQIFRDGFFHGDPHPGNLFVDSNGAINAVDFGIMGRLDIQSRRYLSEMLLAILNYDFDLAAKLHFQAGYVPSEQSIGDFALALRSIAEPILNRPASDISIGRLLGQLFHVTETFGMETQPHLLLLQKVIVVAEGVGRTLNPDANMWQTAQPLVEKWVLTNKSSEHQLREVSKLIGDIVRRGPRLFQDAETTLDRAKKLLETTQVPEFRTRRHNAWMWSAIGFSLFIAVYALLG